MPAILHVTEAFNGGIVELLEKIVESDPKRFHYILCSSRNYDPKPLLEQFIHKNVELISWEGNFFLKWRKLHQIERKLQPEIVHLHSSFAGVIGRIKWRGRKKLLYSPHGFSFQKRDVHFSNRILFWLIEFLLQLNTTANVAFWPIEVDLFRTLGVAKKTYFCPILLDAYGTYKTESKVKWSPNYIRIIGIGRLTAAKDPEFFLEVIRLLKHFQEVSAIWVGDGRQYYRELLLKGDIEVTGWVNTPRVELEIRKADFLLVTSEWDAGPATIPMSINIGTPVISRNFQAARTFGLGNGSTPYEVVQSILEILSTQTPRRLNTDQLNLLSNVTQTKKHVTLTNCYDFIITN